MKAILFVSHGSRSEIARQEIETLVTRIRDKSGIRCVVPAFLELEDPDIPTGIGQCVAQGAREVLVVLNFLNSGRHAGEDIPDMVDAARKRYPRVRFTLTSPLGQHDRLVDLFLKIIDE